MRVVRNRGVGKSDIQTLEIETTIGVQPVNHTATGIADGETLTMKAAVLGETASTESDPNHQIAHTIAGAQGLQLPSEEGVRQAPHRNRSNVAGNHVVLYRHKMTRFGRPRA